MNSQKSLADAATKVEQSHGTRTGLRKLVYSTIPEQHPDFDRYRKYLLNRPNRFGMSAEPTFSEWRNGKR